jgi:hypothetical protein
VCRRGGFLRYTDISVATCISVDDRVDWRRQAPRGGRVQRHRCGRSSPGPTQRMRTGRPAALE